MDQKAIAKVQITDPAELIQETLGQNLLESRGREIDLKSLGQAIQNLDLGMDFLQKIDITYEIVESLLYQIKQLTTPGLKSNLDSYRSSVLNTKISFKKLGVTTQLKQRSQNLSNLLQEIKQYQDISIANHKAAKSAPESLAKAEEFLRTINSQA